MSRFGRTRFGLDAKNCHRVNAIKKAFNIGVRLENAGAGHRLTIALDASSLKGDESLVARTFEFTSTASIRGSQTANSRRTHEERERSRHHGPR